MVMPTAGPVIVTVVMGMAVTMGMPMVITARFAVRMLVPVVVGMPMVMVAAAAGVVMRVGRMARCRCCGHFGRGQCLHVEAQGPDFLGNVACSISATCAARQRQRLICKINLYI
jgi:ABC-type sugar transport system permease subunit